MNSHLNMKSIPPLCFNKDDFAANEFCVDKFVSDCRKHASLETMREDLGIYHKILCAAMIELINKDYADFVNLSSNLVGLDKSINSLTTPLSHLKLEIEKMKLGLDDILKVARNMFAKRLSNYESKVLAHHVLTVEETLKKLTDVGISNDSKDESSQLEALERIAFSFNVVKFHMSKIDATKGKQIFVCKEEAVLKVSSNIEVEVENVFLKTLHNHNTDNLLKILRIYSILSAEGKAETSFRLEIVRPFMKEVVTLSNITKYGLEYIYNQILNFVPNFCSDLLKITQKNNKNTGYFVIGYDFLLNSVWPEIIDCFQSIYVFSSIHSLGDLQQFNNNYSSTLRFLDQFEHCFASQKTVIKFRSLSSYTDFIKRYNLDVYFQIRFQEIASQLEDSLLDNSITAELTPDRKCPYQLKATSTLWTCICTCWNDSTFMPPLKHSFWKLTLQLLSRYKNYVTSIANSIEDGATDLAILISDVEILVAEIKAFYLEVISPKLGIAEKDIEQAFKEAVSNLAEIPVTASQMIIKFLTEKCVLHLKLISNIPQRFRKTNRDLPSKPSPYVAQVFKPLTDFLDNANNPRLYKYFQTEVTNKIFEQCLLIMKEVLTSIKKMEDSLKILKRARDNKQVFSSTNITDDDKIRRQLSIDVEYFEEIVLKSGLETSDVKCLEELKKLVNSAERVSSLPS